MNTNKVIKGETINNRKLIMKDYIKTKLLRDLISLTVLFINETYIDSYIYDLFK